MKMARECKNELPTGLMPMKEMMSKLPFKFEPLSEQLANMNKLGKTYLKAIDIDIDQVNIHMFMETICFT